MERFEIRAIQSLSPEAQACLPDNQTRDLIQKLKYGLLIRPYIKMVARSEKRASVDKSR